MEKKTLFFISIAVSLLAWVVLTWPLPRHMTHALPMGYTGGEEQPLRVMEAGDHLQLLYYFWLFSDMVRGETPWMHNPYEFHTGNEEERHMPSTYYLPFSLVYLAFSLVGGRAFGFNMAGWVSIWLTYLFTWRLIKRYVDRESIAAVAAVVSIVLPYRWFELLAGSPSGFAMALIPLLFWMLDRAVRDGSFLAGLGAGIAVWCCYAADLHAFFFGVLAIPAWCVIALVAHDHFPRFLPRDIMRMAVALLPAAILAAGAVWYSQQVGVDLGETDMEHGRSLAEVMTFSPRPLGFFAWGEHVISSRVYLGYWVTGLILLGLLAAWRNQCVEPEQRGPRRSLRVLILLLLGMVGIGVLAVGPHGPFGGLFFVAVRRLIPSYEMIRQAGKIYVLVPPWWALACALGVASLGTMLRRWPLRRSFIVALGSVATIIGLAEYARRFDPLISLVYDEHPVYATVAADAATHDTRAHVLVVPLWPGDSHFTSVYQYYVSLYRIRMVNGYTPAISQRYFDDIFLPFQSINQGWLTDVQADALRARGITHVILHEDLFPEKVSPFPVWYTIAAFAAHPRLEPLRQDGPVRAYRILAAADTSATRGEPAAWRSESFVYASARHWLFHSDAASDDPGAALPDETASRGVYIALSRPGETLHAGPVEGPPAPAQRWRVRLRGSGQLRVRATDDTGVLAQADWEIAHIDWTWRDLSVPSDTYGHNALTVELMGGTVDLCSALWTAGKALDEVLQREERLVMPAAHFFRAGVADLESGHVHFRAGEDRVGTVFYGPKLPLGRGTYRVEWAFDSVAKPGTPLGELEVEQLFTHGPDIRVPIIAGGEVITDIELDVNLPVNFIVHSTGNDLTLHHVTIQSNRP